jgi:hypothetical protein
MLAAAPADPSVYVYANDADAAQLILANNHDEARTITAPLSGNQPETGALGLDATATYYLHDFWNDEFLGEIPGSGSVSRPLKPFQSLVYSLRRKSDHPQVLSSNRHIMQGMLDQTQWDAGSLTLTGTTRVMAGEPFVLTLAANGHVPAESTTTSGTALVTHDGNLVKLTLMSDSTAEVRWSLVWKK